VNTSVTHINLGHKTILDRRASTRRWNLAMRVSFFIPL
jgi:hypothetical protein